jgi:hypothetical protein
MLSFRLVFWINISHMQVDAFRHSSIRLSCALNLPLDTLPDRYIDLLKLRSASNWCLFSSISDFEQGSASLR